MDKLADQKNAFSFLYPHVATFDTRMVEVGEGHTLYVEQSGNPNGIPVVVLHGGPGGGTNPFMRRFFDPEAYRIILFDQRGCGKSLPKASVEANTTWHLVADIEHIRKLLNIDSWMVFGGSWGATLALAYAQKHPTCVKQLILRGVFGARKQELDWFYQGGAAKFWPDVWRNFSEAIPEEERGDYIEAYAKRLFSGDIQTEQKYGQLWAVWENALASVDTNGTASAPPADFARTFARLENHYFRNDAFFDYDGQLVAEMDKIADIPGVVVQGRYDMICPPQTAYEICERWPAGKLLLLPHSGHAVSEPAITKTLVETMDQLKG